MIAFWLAMVWVVFVIVYFLVRVIKADLKAKEGEK
jgi:hypothetical protein